MIVSLVPHTDFAPVPRIEVRLEEEAFSFDGGGPGDVGPDSLDGGGASTSSAGFDAGTSSTVFVDLPEGTDRVTLWRTCAGRTMEVRGGIRRAFAGSISVPDVEPSDRGLPSSYEVECFSGGVSLGRVGLGSTVLPKPREKYSTIVQQPLDPHLNVVLEELDVMVPSVSRSAPGGLVRTQGNPYPSLIGFGPRGGVEGVEVAFAAPTREVAEAVWATLGSQDRPQLPVWLVRSSHPLLPPVFFCEVLNLEEQGVDLHVGGVQSRFVATVTEVAPPAPSLVVAPLSYADLDVSYASYDDRDAAYGSYSEMDSDWSLAGAAG